MEIFWFRKFVKNAWFRLQLLFQSLGSRGDRCGVQGFSQQGLSWTCKGLEQQSQLYRKHKYQLRFWRILIVLWCIVSCLQVTHAHSCERVNPTYYFSKLNTTSCNMFISISIFHWGSIQLRLDQLDLLRVQNCCAIKGILLQIGPCTSPSRGKACAQCFQPPASSGLLEFIHCFPSIRSVMEVSF